MASLPLPALSDSDDWQDIESLPKKLFNVFNLPPSSPPPDWTMQLTQAASTSTPPRQAPQTPAQAEDTPGPALSSQVRGTRRERAAQLRRKGHKRHRATLAQKRAVTEAAARLQWKADMEGVFQFLQSKNIALSDLMEYVFNPSNGQGNIRWHQFFVIPGAASQVLDWWISSRNAQGARDEVKEWAVNYVIRLVSHEARKVTQSRELQTQGKIIDYDLVTSFSFTNIHDQLEDDLAPVAMRVFKAFSTSRHAEKHSEQRRERTQLVVTSAALACLGEYSHANNLAKRLIALYLYACGAQRQTISVLSTLGLSESYSNLITQNVFRKRRSKVDKSKPTDIACTAETVRKTGTLHQLSDSLRQRAREIARTGLFATVYDNININFRNAEQIVGRHDSQENGTCATLFPLFDAKADDIRTQDLHDAFFAANPLKIEDVLHTREESRAFKEHILFTILRIIVRFGGEGFKKFEKDLEKNQPETKNKIRLHRTDLYPLPAWNIDESTITGNAEVDEAMVEELHLNNIPKFWEKVRFTGGDQLPLARHGKMADIHGDLETHYGKPNPKIINPTSLAFHNARLHRLPITLSPPPPFRVCRDLIFVSLYARILHCLLLESGCASLEDYLKKYTTWDDLVTHARKIHDKYANPSKVEELRWKRARSQAKSPNKKPTEGDMVFENACLFLQDALISREFTDAVKAGDSGRVLLVLKVWALSFRGNGRSKYAYEMLHVIHNLTNVFPQRVRDIILSNWLLNPTGNPNSWVEIDLVQEHLNFWIKAFYKAHGSNASWDWLEKVAPCVEVLRRLARNFNDILGADQGTKHAPADLTDDIRTLMESLKEHEVYSEKKGRILDDDALVPDVIALGFQKLTDGLSSPLNEYNIAFKRLQTCRRRQPVTRASLPNQLPKPSAPENSTLPSTSVPQTSDLPTAIAVEDVSMALEDDLPVEETDEQGSLAAVLDNLEHGVLDEDILPRETFEDVSFDMDEVVVEEEGYFTDGTESTGSISDDESSVTGDSEEESWENNV